MQTNEDKYYVRWVYDDIDVYSTIAQKICTHKTLNQIYSFINIVLNKVTHLVRIQSFLIILLPYRQYSLMFVFQTDWRTDDPKCTVSLILKFHRNERKIDFFPLFFAFLSFLLHNWKYFINPCFQFQKVSFENFKTKINSNNACLCWSTAHKV